MTTDKIAANHILPQDKSSRVTSHLHGLQLLGLSGRVADLTRSRATAALDLRQKLMWTDLAPIFIVHWAPPCFRHLSAFCHFT